MKSSTYLKPFLSAFALSLLVRTAAAIPIPSDGSDGAFNPTPDANGQYAVNLSQAVTGRWDQNNAASAGKGVYDSEKWAVVFKYSSVNIPAGTTVSFYNHPSGAPVVWLVSGDVKIDGGVSLVGSPLGPSLVAQGPGGFKGALIDSNSGIRYTSGFGPGGGAGDMQSPGNYASPGMPSPALAYGNTKVVPLIGGSGSAGGGGGGGAILIAATGSIQVNGAIVANGGGSGGGGGSYPAGGSGGAIRLVADRVVGKGKLEAVGGFSGGPTGGAGRIRVEANSVDPALSTSPPGTGQRDVSNPVIWPSDAEPSVRIVSVSGAPVPADPHAQVASVGADVTVPKDGPQTVLIETRNVPTDRAVSLRVTPVNALAQLVKATLVSGDATKATWSVAITAPFGVSAMQARVEAQ